MVPSPSLLCKNILVITPSMPPTSLPVAALSSAFCAAAKNSCDVLPAASLPLLIMRMALAPASVSSATSVHGCAMSYFRLRVTRRMIPRCLSSNEHMLTPAFTRLPPPHSITDTFVPSSEFTASNRRFDRQVTVDVPDVQGRTDILKVHARNKKLGEGVDVESIAKRTPGFSGADLANLLNEAAILAGRRSKTEISIAEIDDSVDRIVAGMEGTPMTDGKSKSLVAYHEVGHAICGTLTPGHDPVQKVTIIPRGQAKGLTWFTPGEDPTLIS